MIKQCLLTFWHVLPQSSFDMAAVADPQLLKKINHPAINQSFLAEALYGSRESKNRAKLSEKVNGKKGWKEWELQKLKVILYQIGQELQDQQLALFPLSAGNK